MKKLLILILGLFLSTAAVTPASALPGLGCGENCHIIVTIGETNFDLSRFIIPVPGTPLFTIDLNNATVTVAEVGIATVGVTINPDPEIIFSFAGTNFTGGPLFFGLHIDTPVAISGTIDATSSIAYTLTDNGTGGVQLTAGPNPTVAVFTDFGPGVGPDGSTFVINKGVDVGPSVNTNVAGNCDPLVAGGTTTCPPTGSYTAANTFVLPFPATIMNVDIGLFISANDAFSLSGRVTQNERGTPSIPEPATLLLLGTGILGFAGWRRYSSRG